MSEDLCVKIIRDFRQLCDAEGVTGEITLTGGDPLTRPDVMWTAINTAEKLGFVRIDIMTNGDLVTEFFSKRLRDHHPIVKHVQVSLDGLGKTHNEIRGAGSFARATSAIRILQDSGFPPIVMMTVSRRNITDVIPLHEYMTSIGARTLGLDRFSPQGSGNDDSKMVVSTNEWSELCQRVVEWRDKNDWLHTGLIRPLWHQAADCTGGMCSVGLSGLAVLPNGDVLLCRRLPIVVGSAAESTLLDIWTSSSLDVWRDPSSTACSFCADHGVCRGCRAMAYAVTGNAFAIDPHCPGYKPTEMERVLI